jgi:hypothetical protein
LSEEQDHHELERKGVAKKEKKTRLTRVQLHYEAHDPIIQQLESRSEPVRYSPVGPRSENPNVPWQLYIRKPYNSRSIAQPHRPPPSLPPSLIAAELVLFDLI